MASDVALQLSQSALGRAWTARCAPVAPRESLHRLVERPSGPATAPSTAQAARSPESQPPIPACARLTRSIGTRKVRPPKSSHSSSSSWATKVRLAAFERVIALRKVVTALQGNASAHQGCVWGRDGSESRDGGDQREERGAHGAGGEPWAAGWTHAALIVCAPLSRTSVRDDDGSILPRRGESNHGRRVQRREALCGALRARVRACAALCARLQPTTASGSSERRGAERSSCSLLSTRV